jgi:hypothetical protein
MLAQIFHPQLCCKWYEKFTSFHAQLFTQINENRTAHKNYT